MAGRGGAWQAMTPPSPSEMSGSFSDDETKNGDESDSEESAPQKLFSEKRHFSCGNPRPTMGGGVPQWRLKEKLRTARAALVVCLNIGVDPPDVVKTQPCATLECWVDPFSMPSNKALEAIGRNLQHQFENLNPRMNYKPYLDPRSKTPASGASVSARWSAASVPSSTTTATVFPSLPAAERYGTSSPGSALPASLSGTAQPLETSSPTFSSLQSKRTSRPVWTRPTKTPRHPARLWTASSSLPVLPTKSSHDPELPADVFTACLTSPIEMALRFFALRNPLPSNPTRSGVPHLDNVMQLPGDLKDRRTPLGELNWIFTAVTDTIAWTTFPATFSAGSSAKISWSPLSFAIFYLPSVSCATTILPQLRAAEEQRLAAQQDAGPGGSQTSDASGPYQYIPSSFFGDHLTAFQVWLTRGAALSKTVTDEAAAQGHLGPAPSARPVADYTPGLALPDPPPARAYPSLPIHGPRSLGRPSGVGHRDLSLCPKAAPVPRPRAQTRARLCLGEATSRRPILPRRLTPRRRVHVFRQHSLPHTGVYIPNSAEHRAMCAFILSIVARDHPEGQMACLRASVFHMCLIRLDDADYLLRQWSALCIAQLWDGNDDAKKYGIDQGAQDKLSVMMSDHSPNVRAAALYALSVFLGASGSAIEGRNGGGGTGCRIPLQERDQLRLEVAIATARPWPGKKTRARWLVCRCRLGYWEDHGGLNPLTSPSVREQRAAEGALRAAHAQREWADRAASEPRRRDELRVVLTSFFTIYCTLLELSVDPYPEVATLAQTVVDYITALLLDSPFSKLPTSDFPRSVPARQAHYPHQPRAGGLDEEKHPRASQIGRMTDTLKRTTSFAATLKSIATGYAFPAPESPGPSEPDHAGAFLSKDVPRPHILSAQYVPPYPPSSDALVMPAASASGSTMEKSRTTPSTPTLGHGYSAADIIEALVEEDLDRLRGRKHRGAPPPPSSDGTESSLTGSALSGLCTGEGLANVLPLKSRYFDWSCEYFLEPQMRQSEEDEPGSVTYNELMWRRQRNEKILDATDHQAGVAPHCPWDRPVSHFSVDGVPLRIKFHQFDPHIAVIDDTTSLSVWDWSRKKKVVTFNNGNPPGSAITGIHFVNEDAQTMIMTASGPKEPNGHVLPRAEPYDSASKGSGLVTDWQQESGLLLVGGDSRVVRVWDGFQELCLAVSARNLHTNGHMRHLCRVRPESSNLFLASSADGRLCVRPSYRRKRVDGPELASPPELDREFALAKGREQGDMTASLDGEVRLWDLRDRDGVGILGKKWQPHGNALANFALHPKAAVFAAIIVHSIPPVEKPSVLSKFTLPGHTHAHAHISARSPFFAGPSSLSFHPNEMLYATGGIDNIVRVYGCKLRESQEEDVPGARLSMFQG
ncbi:Raptor N-terminal CASPase like domain [Rhizoctonia solani]|uniref:Raptor N-terminal CASPase like domain n=1 Tax=Rhizoctonia solani TaxID=456999 RepID=A0A8H7IGF6_9AGAM|nr:Raptor N-terminal CASPase like domain [Rhizoctonia solani]